MKRPQSQLDAEARREENDKLGKTLVRHDRASKAAMRKVMRVRQISGPEALRAAIIEMAARLH